MRNALVSVLAAAAFAMCAGVADAKPKFKTRYTYYTVAGKTAQDIYKAMLRRGPRVNGAKAYAATSATTTQDGKLRQSKTCRIDNYQLNLAFVIKLPRIKNEKVLPASDRRQWRQFSAFLKTHEETHRSIWLGCAKDLERRVRSIKAKTCSQADKKAAQLWDSIRASCSKKHNAFDKAEQKKLMRHPFVKLVFKRRGRTTHAANTQ